MGDLDPSPVWAANAIPEHYGGNRLLASAIGALDLVLTVATSRCFWSLGIPQLSMAVRLLHLEVPRGRGLGAMLMSCVQQVLESQRKRR